MKRVNKGKRYATRGEKRGGEGQEQKRHTISCLRGWTLRICEGENNLLYRLARQRHQTGKDVGLQQVRIIKMEMY